MLKIAYGHQVKEEGDDYISLADAALTSLGAAGLFGTYAVDYMPWLKYLPSWLPGASFKRKAAEWYKLSRSMVDVPYAEVKRKLVIGFPSHLRLNVNLAYRQQERRLLVSLPKNLRGYMKMPAKQKNFSLRMSLPSHTRVRTLFACNGDSGY